MNNKTICDSCANNTKCLHLIAVSNSSWGIPVENAEQLNQLSAEQAEFYPPSVSLDCMGYKKK